MAAHAARTSCTSVMREDRQTQIRMSGSIAIFTKQIYAVLDHESLQPPTIQSNCCLSKACRAR